MSRDHPGMALLWTPGLGTLVLQSLAESATTKDTLSPYLLYMLLSRERSSDLPADIPDSTTAYYDCR